MKHVFKSICSIILLLSCSFAWAVEPSAVDSNNMGVEKLVAEEPQEAYRYFLESLAADPFNSAVRLNLGLSFEANEEFDKAAREYMSAFRHSKTDEDKFNALFNAGNAFGSSKKIGQALFVYQKALALKPYSKETKKNIELLWQKGGGGGGEGKQPPEDQKDNKEGMGQGQKKKEKPKPKKFDSKNLSKSDVRKILEELKNQEQKIRAKEYEKGPKSAPKDKDW